jgi:hypothetical protein
MVPHISNIPAIAASSREPFAAHTLIPFSTPPLALLGSRQKSVYNFS